ncbi:tautomerase family protein [Tatumella saanichensis]|uniref:tautomerase family protein n=1 Tax=Tatumella saanichensis TaxID=480813 RepID=UPI0004A2C687|nr:tautomerase family protein [Tatumella saanichensis]
MPEVVVFAVEGRSSEQKKKLMKDITDAVVSNFKVDPEVVVVSVVETPKQHKSRGGIPFDEQ